MDKTRLRLAIQKSGRLAEDSFELLKLSGLKIQPNKSGLFYRVKNFPLDLLLVRDDDIPGFVADGVADLGIVGSNVFEEFSLTHADKQSNTLLPLGFSKCTLNIAIPSEQNYNSMADLAGKNIATSYPQILSKALAAKNITANIVEMHGAVEVAPKLGIADAICDIVSSGATLEANGLKSVENIFTSQALLLKTKSQLGPEKEQSLSRLLSRIEGVQACKETKYIMLNAPQTALPEITKLLPGADAPTVMPLEGQNGAVAIHAVCRESVFWETMENLRDAGATSILVLPIEKMMV
ncbi:MAG: ATP phosphoribosyltransferase [Sphingomonadales bacterium]|nr:ATP phosphoribosyltransferase [Sphingomonadales bacterium]